jgi:hypothetical protein
MSDQHPTPKPFFQLGRVVATCGVVAEVPAVRQLACLSRHSRGDWGCIHADDQASNAEALVSGERLMSA